MLSSVNATPARNWSPRKKEFSRRWRIPCGRPRTTSTNFKIRRRTIRDIHNTNDSRVCLAKYPSSSMKSNSLARKKSQSPCSSRLGTRLHRSRRCSTCKGLSVLSHGWSLTGGSRRPARRKRKPLKWSWRRTAEGGWLQNLRQLLGGTEGLSRRRDVYFRVTRVVQSRQTALPIQNTQFSSDISSLCCN